MQQQALGQLQAGLVDELESKGTFQDPETQKIMEKYQKVRVQYEGESFHFSHYTVKLNISLNVNAGNYRHSISKKYVLAVDFHALC